MLLGKRHRLSRLVLASAAALGCALVFSPAAVAATIHACVKKTSGVTRIVGAKTKCKRGEQSLSWNTAGVKGATGAAGPAGANGSNGRTARTERLPVSSPAPT